ncbi:hypothetical protein Tco_1134808 [Tanacetum coccineum]
MEAVSRIFEVDIDIVNEVQRHTKNESDMALLSTLYLAKEDGYNPHCDIDFEEDCNLKHSVLEILFTHDDNRSKDIAKEMDEASLVIDNERMCCPCSILLVKSHQRCISILIVNETIPTLQKLKETRKIRFNCIAGLPMEIFKHVLDRVLLGALMVVLHMGIL